MSKIAALVSVLMLALAGSAFAQDYRSPDAKPALVTQDYRSPDAKPALVTQDFRSPDSQPAGQFQSPVPAKAAPASSDSFDWVSLAIVVAIPLLLLSAYLIVRREHDAVAIGG